MKKTYIFIILLLISIFGSMLHAQTWGNGDPRLQPISHNLVNGMFLSSPPTTTIVSNDTLFYTDYYGFHIYNVSDPSNPVKISSIGLPGKATHLDIEGSYAYVCNESGLSVLDIQDAINPQIIKIQFFGFRPYRMVIEDGYAFFASTDHLYSYAVNDAVQFTALDEVYIEPANVAFAGLSKFGNYVYYVNQKYMHVMDVTDPQNIVELQTYQLGPGSCWGSSKVYNNHLYVVNSTSLSIYNLQNPASPVLVYQDLPSPHSIYEIAIENDIMVINHNSNGEFTVFDISNPGLPQLIYAHSEPWFNHLYSVGTLADRMLYVMDNAQDGYNGTTLHIIDLTNPAQPSMASQIKSLPGKSLSVSLMKKNAQVYALVTQNNDGYNHESGLLRVLNTTHPDEPYLEGTLELSSSILSVAATNEDWAFVTGSNYSFPNYIMTLYLINMQDPSNPVIADAAPIGSDLTNISFSNVSYYGNTVFTVTKGELKLFKVTNGSLSLMGTVPVYGEHGKGVFAYNPEFVCVAGGNSGTQLYNITNPNQPFLVNYYSFGGTTMDVYVDNGIAYSADYSGGLGICRIDQNLVTPITHANTYNYAVSISVLHQTAYVGLSDGRIQLFDVSNPAQPTSIGWYLTNGSKVNDMYIDKDQGKSHLYVANELEMGIFQLDYYVGNQEQPEAASSIAVYPNPATNHAFLSLEMDHNQKVKVELYDLSGRCIKVLSNYQLPAGQHQLELGLEGVKSGLYSLVVTKGDQREVVKLVVN